MNYRGLKLTQGSGKPTQNETLVAFSNYDTQRICTFVKFCQTPDFVPGKHSEFQLCRTRAMMWEELGPKFICPHSPLNVWLPVAICDITFVLEEMK